MNRSRRRIPALATTRGGVKIYTLRIRFQSETKTTPTKPSPTFRDLHSRRNLRQQRPQAPAAKPASCSAEAMASSESPLHWASPMIARIAERIWLQAHQEHL